MGKAKQPKARRAPRSGAGAEIVQAVVAAASEQLAERGYPGLNTNAIAARAGVSIGSLYHYFPNKHAIVAAIAARLRERFVESLLQQPASETPARAIAQYVDATLATGIAQPKLLRALFTEVPPRWMLTDEGADRAAARALAASLASFPDALRSDEVSAFVAFHALRGASRAVLCERPRWLAEAQTRDELFLLLARYLAQPGVVLEPPPRPPLADYSPPPPLPTRSPLPRAPANTARREATLERLLAAAERTLARAPREILGVRAVAAEAGMSPAALYRYFANAEAMLAELVARRELRAAALLEEALGAHAEAPLDHLVAQVVGAMTSPRHGSPGLRYAQAAHLPRSSYLPATRALEERLQRVVADAISERPAECRSEDPARMAFVAIQAVQWALEAVSLRRPELRPEPITAELSSMVARYFSR